MDLISTILGTIGGGLGVAAVKAGRDMYVAHLRNKEQRARVEMTDDKHEREITAQFATEDRSDRRRMEIELRDLHAKVTELSVKVAESRQREANSENSILFLKSQIAECRARDAEREATIKTFENQLHLQSQLIDRQRMQIDDLVRRLMGVESVSIPPPPKVPSVTQVK